MTLLTTPISLAGIFLLLLPDFAWAAMEDGQRLDLTGHGVGLFALGTFFLAYLLVMVEEFTHMRKSKPVLLAAGLIWGAIAWVYAAHDLPRMAEEAIEHNMLEYGKLLLFLLVAMTYINAMEERNVFAALRSRLVRSGMSFRMLFWSTGLLAFCISPVADNLTTALVMCAVVMALGREQPGFIGLACINIVVAANAGGAFSPFGDITTLMVWQKQILAFQEFLPLFLPSVVNWLVPALLMSFAVPTARPAPSRDTVAVKRGGQVVMGLFGLTIATAVCFHNFLHLPPVAGMMTGLAFLKFYGYYLKITHAQYAGRAVRFDQDKAEEILGDTVPFDVFRKIARAEWDTLMFFYGVILCVGGLGFIGYLTTVSRVMYEGWGPLAANITVGILSAIVDNIPVMFAVLTMLPEMSKGDWQLVTLTAGVGGSLLSIGSAAGVALMGQARGHYTFFGHLKWAPAIALGYGASIYVHVLLNGRWFQLV